MKPATVAAPTARLTWQQPVVGDRHEVAGAGAGSGGESYGGGSCPPVRRGARDVTARTRCDLCAVYAAATGVA